MVFRVCVYFTQSRNSYCQQGRLDEFCTNFGVEQSAVKMHETFIVVVIIDTVKQNKLLSISQNG